MRSLWVVWASLAALYGAFLLWHTPLRGPLTATEVSALMERARESHGDAWADARAFEAFLRADDGRPFVMVNVMELRAEPNYPDGSYPEITTASAAADAYGRGVLPLLVQRASYPILVTHRITTILNTLDEEVGRHDTVAVVRYRSRRDLAQMVTSADFAETDIHKWASLANTLVAPSHLGALISIGLIAPVSILFLGAFISFIIIKRLEHRRENK